MSLHEYITKIDVRNQIYEDDLNGYVENKLVLKKYIEIKNEKIIIFRIYISKLNISKPKSFIIFLFKNNNNIETIAKPPTINSPKRYPNKLSPTKLLSKVVDPINNNKENQKYEYFIVWIN